MVVGSLGVLVMVFSEFGRRVSDNASLGTDHGTAGPMFLLGSQVNGGLYGEPSSLGDLYDGPDDPRIESELDEAQAAAQAPLPAATTVEQNTGGFGACFRRRRQNWRKRLCPPFRHALRASTVLSRIARSGTPREALYRLADRVPVVVVTCGSDGALAIDAGTGEVAHAPAVPVEALDPTGAGDVFAAGFVAGTIDRVLMNPPFHDAGRQNVSPDPRRRLAHVGSPGLLRRWIATAAWLLKSDGVLTLIWRADGLDAAVGELRSAFGAFAVQPVLPKPTAPAIRVLIRAVKAGSGTQMNYPPFSLNDEHGEPTVAAEDVLRGGNTLTVAQA